MRPKNTFEKLRIKTQKLTNFSYVRHERYPELNLELKEEDFLYELAKVNPTNLFLGRLTKEEVEKTLADSGLWKLLEERGFENPILKIDAANVLEHRVMVYDGREHPDNLLIEVRLREGIFRPKKVFVEGFKHLSDIPMILIDWLTLQDPTRDFTEDRPRLVHQRKPGLGIFYDFTGLVDTLAETAGKEAVMDIPEHYHGALFYSRLFRFWDPGMEGKLKAMKRDFKNEPLWKVSWAVFLDCLVNETTGELEKWQPGEQIKPVSKRLKKYFDHPDYKRQVKDAFEKYRFSIDERKFERAMATYADEIA